MSTSKTSCVLPLFLDGDCFVKFFPLVQWGLFFRQADKVACWVSLIIQSICTTESMYICPSMMTTVYWRICNHYKLLVLDWHWLNKSYVCKYINRFPINYLLHTYLLTCYYFTLIRFNCYLLDLTTYSCEWLMRI